MAQVIFKELARVTGRAFDDTLDFFSSEPMIGRLRKKNFKELDTLEMMIKRVRIVKTLSQPYGPYGVEPATLG